LIGHFPDPARYGGVVPAYLYPPFVMFLDNGGFIELRCGGPLIDRVDYAMGGSFPQLTPARSIQLDPDVVNQFQNDDGLTWCPGTFPFPSLGGPQFGTPGAPNQQCF
jgi:hypothetical protein